MKDSKEQKRRQHLKAYYQQLKPGFNPKLYTAWLFSTLYTLRVIDPLHPNQVRRIWRRTQLSFIRSLRLNSKPNGQKA